MMKYLEDRFYIYREFNQEHATELRRSSLIYNAVLIIVFLGGYVLGYSPLSLLTLSLAALLAAHIARIIEIRKNNEIVLTRKQIVAAFVMVAALAIVVVWLYAIFIHSPNNPPLSLQTRPSPYWALFSGLYMVMFGSIWTDFLVVHFLRKPDTRVQDF